MADMHNFHDTAERWIEQRFAVGDISERTAKSYRESLNLFSQHAGQDTALADVTPTMILSWLGDMRRRKRNGDTGGCSNGTLYTRLTALRSFFRWAVVTEGLIDVNPCDRVPNPKLKKSVPRDLDPQDVMTVLAKVDDGRTRLMILLAVHMGLRRAEIAGLRAEMVNLRRRELVADGKGNRERKLPVPAEVLEPLTAWMAGLPDGCEWVFPSRLGGHITPRTVGGLVGKAGQLALKRSKRRATTHAYRHTAAVEVLRSTGNVRTVQQMLGHANLATTSRYLGSDVSGLREAMDGRSYVSP